jgi:acyl-coenzyme A synthetase/AMP-(fatty) acid ligase
MIRVKWVGRHILLILLAAAQEDVVAFCRKRIAGYKVPGIIEFVPNMPRNRMGKIVKAQLKEWLRKKRTERGSPDGG